MLLTYPFHFFQHVHPLAESKKKRLLLPLCKFMYNNEIPGNFGMCS